MTSSSNEDSVSLNQGRDLGSAVATAAVGAPPSGVGGRPLPKRRLRRPIPEASRHVIAICRAREAEIVLEMEEEKKQKQKNLPACV